MTTQGRYISLQKFGRTQNRVFLIHHFIYRYKHHFLIFVERNEKINPAVFHKYVHWPLDLVMTLRILGFLLTNFGRLSCRNRCQAC